MSPDSRCPQRIGWGATPSGLVSPAAKRSGASNTCGTSSRNPCSSRPGPAAQGNEPTSATEHRGPKPGTQSAELRPPRVCVGGRLRPSVLLVDARDGLSGPPERPRSGSAHADRRAQPEGGTRRGPPPARSRAAPARASAPPRPRVSLAPTSWCPARLLFHAARRYPRSPDGLTFAAGAIHRGYPRARHGLRCRYTIRAESERRISGMLRSAGHG